MTPYLECPQFEGCSVNDCPLADGQFSNLPIDAETECKARISTRQAIGTKHGLTNGGLTHKELKREERRARWNALPEEEKQKRLAGLKPFQKSA